MKWLLDFFKALFGGGTAEKPSPSDIVPDDSIVDVNGLVTINFYKTNIPFAKTPPKIWICPIPDTNSMDPLFDNGHTNILIQGADKENQDILVNWLAEEFAKGNANIVVFRTDTLYVIHRISQIGYDDKGRWWKFKGDNNPIEDPGIVRDGEIQWLWAGTIP